MRICKCGNPALPPEKERGMVCTQCESKRNIAYRRIAKARREDENYVPDPKRRPIFAADASIDKLGLLNRAWVRIQLTGDRDE